MSTDFIQGFILGILLLLVCWTAHAAPNCEHHPDDDRIALACNIYWEARTETLQGMMAVVAVTLNRVASAKYPDTVREVVWQRKQFSWTHDGKVDRPSHRPSWLQALAIAERFTVTSEKAAGLCPTATQINAASLGRADPGCEFYRNLVNVHVLLAQQSDPTGGALFYYAEYIPPPYWVFGQPSAVIGRHIFYTEARIK
jgi:spore germination cell wall hydrolase CwlJ-like protein